MKWQWLALALFVLWMLVDHFVLWPAFLRHGALDPRRARRTLWMQWAASLWILSALVLRAPTVDAQPLAQLGLAMPVGWRLWAPAAVIAVIVGLQLDGARHVARMAGDKAALRARLGDTAPIMPRDSAELPLWFATSLTAGFCEELLFRGFLVGVLQPFTGPWLAAAIAVAVFGLGHAYQGASGVVRTGAAGAAFMALFLVTGSLWPGIVLHAALDFVGGWIGLLILRDEPACIAIRAGGR